MYKIQTKTRWEEFDSLESLVTNTTLHLFNSMNRRGVVKMLSKNGEWLHWGVYTKVSRGILGDTIKFEQGIQDKKGLLAYIYSNTPTYWIDVRDGKIIRVQDDLFVDKFTQKELI